MDILTGIAAAKSALEVAGALRKTEKQLDAAVLRSQLGDIIEKLTDTRLALVEARDTLAEKDALIGKLKSSFEERGALGLGPINRIPNAFEM